MATQGMRQDLRKLQQSLSKIQKEVDRLADKMEMDSAKGPGNGGAKAAGNGGSGGKILLKVHRVIKRSRKGIAVREIKEKTGLDDRQISNALYKLTKKGSVEAKARGVYVASE